MKRKYGVLIVAMLTLTMMLAGCGSSNFGVVINEDLNVEIIAENAKPDMEGTTATFTVEEGQDVVIEPAFDEGSILVQFYALDEELNEGNMNPEGDPDYEVEVSGTEPIECGFGTGDFMVRASVVEKANGNAVIRARSEEGPEQWNKADSAEEAAKAAGLDMFEAPGVGTPVEDMEITSADYRYMEGVVEANVPFGAVEMFIHKGLASIDGGDISFDNNEYAHEWTQDVNGTEVKCFGNREGEATKTIWTNGDYSYAILAYGAGGDTDYGLRPEALAALVSAVK